MQNWQILLLISAMAFGCGGDTKGDSDPDFGAGGSSTGGTNSAGAANSGGASTTGGQAQTAGIAGANSGGASTTGGQAQSAGGTPSGGQGSGASGAGGAAACDADLEQELWQNVALYAVGAGTCNPQLCESSDTFLVGAISFNAEGRVTGVRGFKSSDAWREYVADKRWPCYASQALPYCCDVAP